MSANQYYGGGPSGGPQYPQQAQYQGPPGQGDKGMFNHGQQQYQQPGGYGMQQPMQYGPPGGQYGGYPNQGYPQQQPVFVQQGPPPKGSGGGGGCCAACCGVLAGLCLFDACCDVCF